MANIFGLLCGKDIWIIVWQRYMDYCVAKIYGLLCGKEPIPFELTELLLLKLWNERTTVRFKL